MPEIIEFIRFDGELKVATCKSMDLPKTIDRVLSVDISFGLPGKCGENESFTIDLSRAKLPGGMYLKDALMRQEEALSFILDGQNNQEKEWDDYAPV